jgi:hypothetical protein
MHVSMPCPPGAMPLVRGSVLLPGLQPLISRHWQAGTHAAMLQAYTCCHNPMPCSMSKQVVGERLPTFERHGALVGQGVQQYKGRQREAVLLHVQRQLHCTAAAQLHLGRHCATQALGLHTSMGLQPQLQLGQKLTLQCSCQSSPYHSPAPQQKAGSSDGSLLS